MILMSKVALKSGSSQLGKHLRASDGFLFKVINYKDDKFDSILKPFT
jgi:hypothetical protein